MSYSEIAQMELMNAINSIKSESDLNEFKDMLARYFASKAQKAIDALWNDGVINNDTIEEWGEEHMRTPYRYETNRPWYWPRLSVIKIKEFVAQICNKE